MPKIIASLTTTSKARGVTQEATVSRNASEWLELDAVTDHTRATVHVYPDGRITIDVSRKIAGQRRSLLTADVRAEQDCPDAIVAWNTTETDARASYGQVRLTPHLGIPVEK